MCHLVTRLATVFFASIILSSPVHAINLTIDQPLVLGELVSFVATISGSTSNYYLQGAMRKEGTTQFFGATQNESGEWIPYLSSPDKEYLQNNFLQSSIAEASWSATITLKFAPDDPLYFGPGVYEVRLRRFTGNSTSPAGESNPLLITLSLPILTSPSPSPTTTPTPSPAPPTPSPSPTPPPSPTPARTIKDSPIDYSSDDTTIKLATVQGIATTSAEYASSLPSQSPITESSQATNSQLVLCFGLGLFILSLAVYLFLKSPLGSIIRE